MPGLNDNPHADEPGYYPEENDDPCGDEDYEPIGSCDECGCNVYEHDICYCGNWIYCDQCYFYVMHEDW